MSGRSVLSVSLLDPHAIPRLWNVWIVSSVYVTANDSVCYITGSYNNISPQGYLVFLHRMIYLYLWNFLFHPCGAGRPSGGAHWHLPGADRPWRGDRLFSIVCGGIFPGKSIPMLIYKPFHTVTTMSAIYDFKENPGQDPDQENPLFYPYLISSGTVSCQKIMEEICRASTFTVPDLQGALHALSETVIHYLNDGYRIELSHFGYFSPTVGATRPVYDPKKVRSKDIYFNGVNFRPSAAFRKSLNGKLKRARPGQRHRRSSDRSDEECLCLLLDHLKKYPFITRLDYSALTGKLKNTAMKQLKRFIAAGHIVSDGTGNRVIYMLPVRE